MMNIIELARKENIVPYIISPRNDEYLGRLQAFANAVIKARDAELQAQSEPVAWMTPMGNVFAKHQLTEAQKADLHPLYTHPAPVHQEPVTCKNLCELCEKRGYIYCANAAKTTPLPLAPVQLDATFVIEGTKRIAELEAQNKALLEALKSAAEAMDNCFYAVADVALTDDLNDFRATIKQARAAIAQVEGKK